MKSTFGLAGEKPLVYLTKSKTPDQGLWGLLIW